jgi:aspartyl-tRNA(Asn)/glutamyl-tRNA(Gln) amidotransferase subunit A
MVPGPLAGIPMSIKNLCDVAGEITLAGSKALDDAPAANADAPVVARLRAAGAVIVGSTNMSEFAFSGVGFNPHYGTPGNPADRTRVPGGSSSGAAVSVADRMAVAALGTDTGGSVRIPSAVCGLVGFKPTARRVPIDNVVPLSTSLDSIGPLANSVECCAIVDAVFAGEFLKGPIALPDAAPLAGLRFGIPKQFVMDELDATVAKAFDRACKALSAKGVKIESFDLPQLNELPAINAKGGFAASEAYAWHQKLIARRGKDYDQIIHPRIMRGKEMSAADYIDLLAARADLQKRVSAITSTYDAVIMPTCAIVAPTLDEVSTPEGFTRKNLLLLRNTTVGNFLDRCGISLPCHAAGELPVGFQLMGEAMADQRILAMARSVAPVVRA